MFILDGLMQATLIELEKEKELARIERATTMMFPNSSDAPTMKSYMQVRIIIRIDPSRIQCQKDSGSA